MHSPVDVLPFGDKGEEVASHEMNKARGQIGDISMDDGTQDFKGVQDF